MSEIEHFILLSTITQLRKSRDKLRKKILMVKDYISAHSVEYNSFLLDKRALEEFMEELKL